MSQSPLAHDQDYKKPQEEAVLLRDNRGMLIDPELILSKPSKVDRSQPAKLFGMPLPGSVSDALYNFNDWASRLRFNTLSTLPAIITNHSSNVVGATQLVGETLYFKSTNVGILVRPEHKGTIKAITHIPLNIVRGVFKNSALRVDATQLLSPKFLAGEVVHFFNLKRAAQLDFARDGKLTSQWGARSSFAGMTSMAIASLFPDEKDTPEDMERIAKMQAEHPVGYVGYRLGKALAFPVLTPVRLVSKLFDQKGNHHLGDGKREYVGVGMLATGFFSVLAGFRQPQFNQAKEIWRYAINWAQMTGGAITTFAGFQLLTGTDNQQGWTNYGSTQLWRMVPLPFNIYEKNKSFNGFKDPKGIYYLAAQVMFVSKNIMGSLTGGAQTVFGEHGEKILLDQQKKRLALHEKVRQEHKQHKLAHHSDNVSIANDSDAVPETKLAKVETREAAMPERVAAQQQMQAQAEGHTAVAG